MLIPRYWAETRLQQRAQKRQITVRRFGWSDDSQAAAQNHADRRAQEALQRIVSGEKLDRRERKQPYNGADGMPIREEILGHHGSAVLTRNGYGAQCLNTPNVLFVDIDFPNGPSGWLIAAVMALGWISTGALGWAYSAKLGIAAAVFVLLFGWFLAEKLYRVLVWIGGGEERRAWRRIVRFANRQPDWHLRVYRTPAGFRVLALHALFDPADAAVAQCFRALKVDPLYQRMCLNQRCFRARVSPKPWRIGIAKRMKPSPGVWPVNPARLAERQRWVENYERKARGFAACRFVQALGSPHIHPAAQDVQILHDDLCQATSLLPIA
jgi:hypothetical protein